MERRSADPLEKWVHLDNQNVPEQNLMTQLFSHKLTRVFRVRIEIAAWDSEKL